MKNLAALVLIAFTTCAGEDLKVTLVIENNHPQRAQSAPLPADRKCPGSGCVSLTDKPGIHQETMYVHGSSQRLEFQGFVPGQGFDPPSGGPLPREPGARFQALLPHMAVITHCDTGQVIELDLDSREYREFKQPKYPSEKQFVSEVQRVRQDVEKKARWNRVDTGESKEFFGLIARHQITTISQKVFLTEHEEVVDGWYLDLPLPGCAPEYLRQGEAEIFTFDTPSTTDVLTSCNCLHRGGDWSNYRAYSTMFWAEAHFIPVAFREVTWVDPTYDGLPFNAWTNLSSNWLYVGYTPRGLAVEQTISGEWSRTRSVQAAAAQGEESSVKTSIVELSTAPVDPALFEIPPGFVKVKNLYRHSAIRQGVSK